MAPEREEDHQAERQEGRQPQVHVQVQVLPGEHRRRGHPGHHAQAVVQAGEYPKGCVSETRHKVQIIHSH